MKTDTEIKDYLKTHPGISSAIVAKNLRRQGVSTDRVRRLRGEVPGSPPASRSGGLSRKQFAAQFDHDTRIRTAIAKGTASLTSLDDIVDDSVFRRDRCGSCPTSGWREVCGEEPFSKYRFFASGKIFWANPKTKQWALENIHGAKDV